MKPRQLNGYEIMKNIKEGIYPMPSMSTTVPMSIIKVEKGRVVVRASATDMHLNPMGGVHGGFAATVLDTATGCAVNTVLDTGESYSTIDLNVKMLRPVPVGKYLFAEGVVLNRTRRLAVSEASLVDESGKKYAHATSTCMVLTAEGNTSKAYQEQLKPAYSEEVVTQ